MAFLTTRRASLGEECMNCYHNITSYLEQMALTTFYKTPSRRFLLSFPTIK